MTDRERFTAYFNAHFFAAKRAKERLSEPYLKSARRTKADKAYLKAVTAKLERLSILFATEDYYNRKIMLQEEFDACFVCGNYSHRDSQSQIFSIT